LVLLQRLPERYKSSFIVTSCDQDLANTLRFRRKHLTVSGNKLKAFSEAEALDLFKALLIEGEEYQTSDIAQ
jgi:hypothetical protein